MNGIEKTVEELRAELVPVSHNKCSTKTCEKILDAVASDKVKNGTEYRMPVVENAGENM